MPNDHGYDNKPKPNGPGVSDAPRRSRRSIVALDAFNFFLADLQTRVGPYSFALFVLAMPETRANAGAATPAPATA